LSSSFINQLIY